MSVKLPPDSFALYVGLGPERSYSTVAEHYHCTKRAVVKCARREGWAQRLADIEAMARKQTDAKLAETISEIDERHRKLLRGIAARAMKALAEHPLETGMEGVRAAEIVVKLERLLVNQPTEHTTVTVEATTKAELDRFVIAPTSPDDDGEEEDDDGEDY